jgi:hypothetical protein
VLNIAFAVAIALAVEIVVPLKRIRLAAERVVLRWLGVPSDER